MDVTVGRVGRAHGIRGEVAVQVLTDEPERRLAVGVRLSAGARTLEVDTTRWHSGRLLVRFVGIADRTAAETLRGARLTAEVETDERPDDPEEFYDRQLIGLRVLTDAGPDGGTNAVGTVTDVLHLPAHDVLEIDRDGVSVLVPFVTALVPSVDLDAGVLVVADRPGLLDPASAENAGDSIDGSENVPG